MPCALENVSSGDRRELKQATKLPSSQPQATQSANLEVSHNFGPSLQSDLGRGKERLEKTETKR